MAPLYCRCYARQVFSEFYDIENDDPGRRLWSLQDMLYGIGLLLLSLVAVWTAMTLIGFSPTVGGQRANVGTAGWTITFELLFGGSVLLLAWKRGLRSEDLGFVPPRSWRPAAIAWAGSYGILASYGILLLVLDRIGVNVSAISDANPLPPDLFQNPQAFLLFSLAVIVVAPVSEELFFRALLFRGLRGYWRQGPSLLVSGLAFGLFHINPAVLLPFTFIGMLFGWANEQTGSLWTSIAAHAAINGVSLLLGVAIVNT